MDAFEFLAPAALVLGLWFVATPFLPRDREWVRWGLLFAGLLLVVRYLPWRIANTLAPLSPLTVDALWAWFVFAIEIVFLLDMLKILLMQCRSIDRSGEADAAQRNLEGTAPDDWPSVDVFIPTYNEPREVLERSIIGALALDYPRFDLWVLDDGKRDWLRDYCAEVGAGYLTRADGKHAKAGNLNNALARTSGELVAVFDADFVPFRWFLRRTVGLFREPDVGIVQTPQHFFNRDPVQKNLWLFDTWPDEQRLFFDRMAPSLDAWDAMFCCGSCSVLRRAAIEKIGGIPTASITEDILSTLAMLRAGYHTRYLNERLSIGLAAESLEAFHVQRQRWCQGGLQTMFLREGVFGPGLDFIRRVFMFPIYWLFHIPARLIVLLIPVLFFWFDLNPLYDVRSEEVVFWMLPVLLFNWLTAYRYFGRGALPVLSDAIATVVSIRLLPTVVSSLIKPFGKPFRVTPKGSLAGRYEVAVVDLSVIAALFVATLGGFWLNAFSDLRIVEEENLLNIAVVWSLFNLATLAFAALICIEVRPRRADDRFGARLGVRVRVGGAEWDGTTRDISVLGARVHLPRDASAPRPDAAGTIVLPEVGDVPFRVEHAADREIGISFGVLPEDKRTALTRLIYTSRYESAAPEVPVHAVLGGLVRRMFGAGP